MFILTIQLLRERKGNGNVVMNYECNTKIKKSQWFQWFWVDLIYNPRFLKFYDFVFTALQEKNPNQMQTLSRIQGLN